MFLNCLSICFLGEIKSHCLLFLSAKADGYKSQVEMVKEVAAENKGDLLFVTIDTDEDDHKRIMEFFGMEVIDFLKLFFRYLKYLTYVSYHRSI